MAVRALPGQRLVRLRRQRVQVRAACQHPASQSLLQVRPLVQQLARARGLPLEVLQRALQWPARQVRDAARTATVPVTWLAARLVRPFLPEQLSQVLVLAWSRPVPQWAAMRVQRPEHAHYLVAPRSTPPWRARSRRC